nr:RecName: Full=Pancreatic IgW, short secretory form [Ginglymostoma cirratum]
PAVQGNDKKYTMSSVLKVSAADWKTNRFYQCQAGYNLNDMVESRFETPKIQEPNITALVPSVDFISSQNAVLGCVISGFAPDNIRVSWKKDQVDQTGVVLSSKRRTDNTFETISYLIIPTVNWKIGDKYTCEVSHPPSNFRSMISMKYQEGEKSSCPSGSPPGTCPPCSLTPELLYHTNLSVTLRNGEKH